MHEKEKCHSSGTFFAGMMDAVYCSDRDRGDGDVKTFPFLSNASENALLGENFSDLID